MTLAPLLSASPVIQIHVAFAVLALGLGLAQLALPKGNRRHKLMGYFWTLLMVGVAISSFWIHELRSFGPFSAIHLLSILTLVSLPYAIIEARRGNHRRHSKTMQTTFWLALVVAGAFTLLPGRIMHGVFFG